MASAMALPSMILQEVALTISNAHYMIVSRELEPGAWTLVVIDVCGPKRHLSPGAFTACKVANCEYYCRVYGYSRACKYHGIKVLTTSGK